MYNQYRSTSRTARIAASGFAFVTVLGLFDFVATLGKVSANPVSVDHASLSTVVADSEAGQRSDRVAGVGLFWILLDNASSDRFTLG